MAKLSGLKYPMRRELENHLPPESWLPPGWAVEDKVRRSGTLAGRIDKAYDLSAVKKLKKSLTTAKKKACKFDFFLVPEKIKWVFLTDTDMNHWTPLTGNEMVAESIAQDWVAVAADLIGGNAGDHPML